jgi:hypothetical protein
MSPKANHFEDTNINSACEYENAGWCEKKGRCKDKWRVYKEGPRGGKVKSDSYSCKQALYK